MSTALALVHEVEAAGGRLEAREGRLRVTAPEPLPDALVASLRRHKPALIALLAPGADKRAIVQWLNRNPPRDVSEDDCAHCRAPLGEVGNDTVPFLLGDGRHVWLHHRCHAGWMTKRRAEAAGAVLSWRGVS